MATAAFMWRLGLVRTCSSTVAPRHGIGITPTGVGVKSAGATCTRRGTPGPQLAPLSGLDNVVSVGDRATDKAYPPSFEA